MGYESFVEGKARGKKLVEQLQQMGFVLDDGDIRTPQRYLTGLVVVDEETIAGTQEWAAAYGFDELVEALHHVEELGAAYLECRGEEGERQRHVYFGGRWYRLLTIEACVEEDAIEAARAVALEALAPYALPA